MTDDTPTTIDEVLARLTEVRAELDGLSAADYGARRALQARLRELHQIGAALAVTTQPSTQPSTHPAPTPEAPPPLPPLPPLPPPPPPNPKSMMPLIAIGLPLVGVAWLLFLIAQPWSSDLAALSMVGAGSVGLVFLHFAHHQISKHPDWPLGRDLAVIGLAAAYGGATITFLLGAMMASGPVAGL